MGTLETQPMWFLGFYNMFYNVCYHIHSIFIYNFHYNQKLSRYIDVKQIKLTTVMSIQQLVSKSVGKNEKNILLTTIFRHVCIVAFVEAFKKPVSMYYGQKL